MSCFVDGSPNSKLMIVLMAPGRVELAEDRVAVGPTGSLLWGQLKRAAGIDRSECYLLNVCGEWPEGPGGSPTAEQLDRWWDRFDSAISLFQGRVALLLGGDALTRVTGLTGIEGWRGYLVEPSDCTSLVRRTQHESVYKTNTKHHRKGDRKVAKVKLDVQPVLPSNLQVILPTLHPSSIMRTGFSTLPAFHADLRRVARALASTLGRSRVTFVEYPVVTTDSSPVAFDIETGGIDGGIQRIGIANALDTYTLLWDDRARAATAMELSSERRVKVAHNVGFDLPRLERAGVAIPDPLFDTMLAAQMLQPDLYKGLNSVASLYLDRKRWKHEAEDRPAFYNAQDASVTLELHTVLSRELQRTGQDGLFGDVVMPTIRTLVGMSQRGIKVHAERRREWIAQLNGSYQEMLHRWYGAVGDINPHSPLQVARLLYDTWKLPRQYNKYGGSTTEESGLRALIQDAEVEGEHGQAVRLLLDLRENQKLRSVYAEHPIGDDGRVHPSYLPGAKDVDQFNKGMAGTGRITAKDPNIQNQPPEARLLFIPSSSDLVLVEADFDAIEARIMAALAQDEELERAIASGLHQSNMAALGVDKTRAKNGFYGWLYGAGERTLSKVFASKGYSVSIRDCRRLLDGFEARFKKVSQYRQWLLAQVEAQYYLVNPFGRRRYFYNGRSSGPAALDFIPQSSAADIMWRILKPLDGRLTEVGGSLLSTVHDSILAEIPASKLTAGVACIRDTMEATYDDIAPGFRVPVKIKVSESSWGEMRDYEQSM